MPEFSATDWYRFPRYYDVIFGKDTALEADFLEAVLVQHARTGQIQRAHILEPACGSGRLVIELARRGHRVAGFDASPDMVAYARGQLKAEPPAVGRAVRLSLARMESFRLRGPFDLVHCLLSTFKYLLSEEHALSHLRRVARVLKPGGLFVLGLHLTDYSRTRTDREVWRGTRDGVSVTCETITRPPDASTRREWLRNRLTVRHRGRRRLERLETNWQCRTYSAAEFRALLSQVPALKVVACHDFRHDADSRRRLDDTQEDVVIVLRRQV